MRVTQTSGFDLVGSTLHRQAPSITHDTNEAPNVGDSEHKVLAPATVAVTKEKDEKKATILTAESFRPVAPSVHERNDTKRWDQFENERVSVRKHALENGRERIMGGSWYEIEVSTPPPLERHAGSAAAIDTDMFCFGGTVGSSGLQGALFKLEVHYSNDQLFDHQHRSVIELTDALEMMLIDGRIRCMASIMVGGWSCTTREPFKWFNGSRTSMSMALWWTYIWWFCTHRILAI
jgi:hypothetical protein